MCDKEQYDPYSNKRLSGQFSDNVRLSARRSRDIESHISFNGPSLANLNIQMSYSDNGSGRLSSIEFGSFGSDQELKQPKNHTKSRPSIAYSALDGKTPNNRPSQIENLFNPTPDPKAKQDLYTPQHLNGSTPQQLNPSALSSILPKPLYFEKKIRRREKVSMGNCRCKASRCLKLYCECFAKGQVCGKSCNCHNCHNSESLPELRALVLAQTVEKNPYAFREKYKAIEGKEEMLHSRGCTCTKTLCIKNYCECFSMGIGCSRLCKCLNCKNRCISITDEQVQVYHERVLRKRRKRMNVDINKLGSGIDPFSIVQKTKKIQK